MSGKAAFTALRGAQDHNDNTVREIAIESLAARRDPALAPRLLRQLKSARSFDSFNLIPPALKALEILRNREALALIDDLLVITTDFGGEHPVWGSPIGWPGWAERIHRVLLALDADTEIQQRLDKALTSKEPVARLAAIKEFSRWFSEKMLKSERRQAWQTPERLQRLLQLTLSDPETAVRNEAAEVLTVVEAEFLKRSLDGALDSESVEIRVAAGDALVHLEIESLYLRAAEVMRQIIESNRTPEIRRRAGKILAGIPSGLQPYYEPIQTELSGGSAERALTLIEERLKFLPDDVNLFWWQAHALKKLGQLDQAAESYERATQLGTGISIIPQALAKTFLDLNDYPRAVEAARRSVQISPADPDAQAILARSSYKAGAIDEAVQAASKAVDLDPVHSEAIWVLVLGQLSLGNAIESRAAFEHALKVYQSLYAGLDTSFIPIFLEELDAIDSDNPEISQFITEIKGALNPE